MIKTVIVVFGLSGAGKDTFADMLAEKIGRDNVLRCSFADPLKAVAKILFGMPHEVAYGSQQAKLDWKWRNRNARWLLQKIGTEGARNIYGDDIWVSAMAELIKKTEGKTTAIISDGRFLSEKEGLRLCLPNVDVYNVLITRPGIKTIGHPPTVIWRLASAVTNMFGVRHVFKKPVVLMHQSESEVWFMEQAVKDGERIFDWVVHNKFSLGVLCDMAGDCIQSLSTFQ